MRSKVLSYLREENVRILHADTPPGASRPDEVRALVRGHRGTYRVVLTGGVWSCPCGAEECAHAAAVATVTGYRSAASKPEKTRSAA
ncbi:hypothetical protein [Actinomadura madurae]|uniref:hypothetical protein n=1 Tax=Actinomadura madurae TaxID=1993 RepID=UPI0020D24471|nr:hypothetical protein [Actinomadura madurae]MCP9947185.1 hypothetical protein [Actinomadura madurae]MCP9963950.1 hypothetical protein [Actinomadura madurae]MCP9976425.1 hypothetical protein [Actinomadura madurae]MCQ0012083.1 hypothetical protein [Actinomadura madurae]MCQ0012617.1 hypothetical protein [Actinomadura madurae]